MKYKYVKILIEDPYNNRDIIVKVIKKQSQSISILFIIFVILLLSVLVFNNSLLFQYYYHDIITWYSTVFNIWCPTSNLFEGHYDLSVIPLLTYDNSENKRKEIIKDNKDKSGVYRWINNINGKCYIGSSANLSIRLKQYYSYKYLNRTKSVSPISRGIAKYGHSNFTLEIL